MDSKLPENIAQILTPPPSENVGKKIVMFGTPTCPDCALVKKFFAQNAIEYEYHDLEIEKEALKWVSSFTQIVPVLILPDGEILYEPNPSQLAEKIKNLSVNQKITMVEPQIFDTIIIGAGPAGLSAAIYAVRKSLKVLLITKEIGGQAALSGDIENYLGFSLITGADLAAKFREDVERFKGEGIWIKEGVAVKAVSGEEGNFIVKTDSAEYQGKTIIIASGRIPKMLNIPGEKEFLGRGVATCATCDAPLYKGKDVVIIGGGNSALDAAYSLMKIAKTVKIVNIADSLNGDEVLLKNVSNASNVEIFNHSTATQINGDKNVQEVIVQNTQTHESQTLAVQGVFVEIGWTPTVDFIPQVVKNKNNEVIVDEFGQTSLPGIWAAGDVNNLWGEQIVIAAGEGSKVALVVAEHIAKIPHHDTSNVHEG